MKKNPQPDNHKKPALNQEEVDYRDVAEQLSQEVAELTESLQRERADAMNVRRRAEEDRLKLAGFYKSQVVRELLPVIDNIDRSLKHIPKEIEGNDYIKGIQGIAKQFADILTKLGVEKIKTVGEQFDPEIHEAVSMDDSGNGHVEIVSDELQSGYKMQDEVLRHAMVRVTLS